MNHLNYEKNLETFLKQSLVRDTTDSSNLKGNDAIFDDTITDLNYRDVFKGRVFTRDDENYKSFSSFTKIVSKLDWVYETQDIVSFSMIVTGKHLYNLNP